MTVRGAARWCSASPSLAAPWSSVPPRAQQRLRRERGTSPESSRPTAQVTSRLFVANNRHRAVTGKYQNKDLKIGTRLCFQGAKSGNDNCGDVNRAGKKVRIRGRTWLNQEWCAKPAFGGPGQGGDSGGPVYHVNSNQSAKAAGILWATGNVNETPSWCFSSIGNVLSALGASLVT